jgi:type IV pilus assembly protein PilA
MNQNKGFTVIELMAIVAIVSILSVIALSVYGDYIVRSKVSEGISFAAEAKTSVSSYYYDQRDMPEDNRQAGLPGKDQYDKHQFVRRLEITTQPRPGTITITFKISGSKADNKLLQLIPDTSGDVVRWDCISPATNGIDRNQVPPNCRG